MRSAMQRFDTATTWPMILALLVSVVLVAIVVGWMLEVMERRRDDAYAGRPVPPLSREVRAQLVACAGSVGRLLLSPIRALASIRFY